MKFVYQGHRVKVKVTGARNVSVYILFTGGLSSNERRACYMHFIGVAK